MNPRPKSAGKVNSFVVVGSAIEVRNHSLLVFVDIRLVEHLTNSPY